MNQLYNKLTAIKDSFADIKSKLKTIWGIDYTGKPTGEYSNMFSDITKIFDGNGQRANFQNAFSHTGITVVPPVNTANSQLCNYMFAECSELKSVPALDLSNVININSIFYQCSALKYVSFTNFGKNSEEITATSAFSQCASLETIIGFDCSNVTMLNTAFTGCASLQEISLTNTSKVISFDSAFRNCASLKTITGLDFSSATTAAMAFMSCPNLENINLSGVIKVSLSLSDCTLLTHDSLMKIINALSPDTSGKILNFGTTNISKLTAEELSAITEKGWIYS